MVFLDGRDGAGGSASGPGSQPLERPARHLGRLMAFIGIDVVEPAGWSTQVRLLHLAPGACLYRSGDARAACYLIRRGFILRKGANGQTLRAEGLAGPGEVLGLDGPQVRRHDESAVALSAVDVALIDLPVLWSCPGLQARIVAGPQSVACLGHWKRHQRWASLPARERLAASLQSLAAEAHAACIDLAGAPVEVADLAHWLAMSPESALDVLPCLAREGLLHWNGAAVVSIDTAALLAWRAPPQWTDVAPRPSGAPGQRAMDTK